MTVSIFHRRCAVQLFAVIAIAVSSFIAEETRAQDVWSDYGCSADCDSNGCDDCRSAEACCGPQWTFSADALFLHRSDPDSNILGFNTNDPTERFNASDLDFGTSTGFDLSLTRRFNSGLSTELRYFAVEGWDATFVGQTTANDLLQFNAAVPVFVTAGDAVSARYESKLHNAEYNLKHACYDCVDFLVGFRYLELDERGSADLVNAAIPFNYSVAARNRLYGAQFGAHAWLWNNDSLSLDSTAKFGVFGNHASQDSSTTTGVATLQASGNDDGAALVGEFGLNGSLCLSDCLAIRCGYRLLWIDSVATAAEQLGATDFFAGTGINDSGDVLYQGVFVGFEFTR